jgi:hypothetical protein
MERNPGAKPSTDGLKSIDWAVVTSIAVLLVFCLTLLTAYFFPIYPDEIQVRFWLSRLPYDFPDKISGAPRCLSTFIQTIPVTMYIPGLIDWLVHGRLETIAEFRQVGVVAALLWIAALACYLDFRARTAFISEECILSSVARRLYIAGFMVAIFSVGVFPFFLVTNRSEQLILPSVVFLIGIFLVSDDPGCKGNSRKTSLLIIAYFVSISLVLYAHPKGLFLAPFFVIVGWKLFSRFSSYLPFAVAMALLAFHLAQGYLAFKYAFQCPEVPKFQELLKSFSFDPGSLLYDPRHFLDQTVQSLMRSTRYLDQLGFQEVTDADYLPDLPLSKLALFANVAIKANIVFTFLLLAVLLPLLYYQKDILAGRFVSINLLLLVLLICTVIAATFNLPKNWYDAGYLYALWLIIFIFFIGENSLGKVRRSIVQGVVIYLACVAMLSQSILVDRNLPAFLLGYVGPGVSVAEFDSSKAESDLANAARACNVDPVHSRKLVVDDYTYSYFRKSKWPMAATYIFVDDDQDVRKFFSEIESDGLVMRCASMKEEHRGHAKVSGAVCCLGKAELIKLFSTP